MVHNELKNSRFSLPAWQQHLLLEETTLAEALKRFGYSTAYVGKWHLDDPERPSQRRAAH